MFLLLKKCVPVLVRGFYEIDFVVSETTIKDGEDLKWQPTPIFLPGKSHGVSRVGFDLAAK